MQRIGLILILLAAFYGVKAQEEVVDNKARVSAKLDLHSSHLWRGFKNGNTFSIQPTISVSKGNLNVGSWAAYAGNDSYFEVDIFTEYTYRSITFSLYDYYCPKSTQMNGFLEFRKFHTRHTLDAMINWNPENLPLKLLVSTFVLGDDISPNNGRQAYSTYIEPALTWKFKRFSGDILFGFTPFAGYYSSKPSIVNLSTVISYIFKVNRFEMPINSKVSYNPVLKTFWYSIGLSFSSDL